MNFPAASITRASFGSSMGLRIVPTATIFCPAITIACAGSIDAFTESNNVPPLITSADSPAGATELVKRGRKTTKQRRIADSIGWRLDVGAERREEHNVSRSRPQTRAGL